MRPGRDGSPRMGARVARGVAWAAAVFVGGLLLGGCTGTGGDSDGLVRREVTWYKDVQPVIMENCVGCHYSGSPQSLGAFDSYETSKAYASAILAKVEGDDSAPYNMPPFPPIDQDPRCEIPGPLRDDPRLSEIDVKVIHNWVAQDMPEGDPADEAPFVRQPPPGLSGSNLMEFAGVNHSVPAARADRITGLVDLDHTQCFSVGLDPENSVLLTGFEVVTDPAAPDIVHHVIIGTDPYGDTYPALQHDDAFDGQFHDCESDTPRNSVLMYTYTPGGAPLVLPKDSAFPLRGGARITFTVHYHRGQTEVLDNSTLRLSLAEETPTYLAYMGRFGAASTGEGMWTYRKGRAHGGWDKTVGSAPFALASGDEDYKMTWKEDNMLPRDYPIWSVFPHMHYAGTGIKISLEHNDGSHTCLGHINPFDFAWQTTYQYERPIEELPVFGGTDDGKKDGDVVKIACTYNNTMGNDRLRDALLANGYDEPLDVVVGEDSFDEMCVMHYGLILPWP